MKKAQAAFFTAKGQGALYTKTDHCNAKNINAGKQRHPYMD